MDYATVDDLEIYWRALTEAETTKAEALISDVSSKIRLKAKSKGIDFDERFNSDSDLANVTKSVVCKCVANAIKVSDALPLSQFSEAVGGYTISGTYASNSAGGGIILTKNDWKELGLGGQKYGGLDIYGFN